MTRLSGGMKAALRAFADTPDEWLSRGQLVLNGATASSLSSLAGAGLVERQSPTGWRSDGRRRWFRLTEKGREELERIGG